uniref:ZP domain-containing protein n=1 Tax=Poecilia mexicana TaxID=48701 RepID=A0A3B3XJA3_9TELE
MTLGCITIANLLWAEVFGLISTCVLALHSAKLKRLAPSVHCGSNQMTLSVKRRGTHHFLIDNGEEPLTPLSQMPSTCGFFVKRSRRDVQYAASYQGCHVNKQGDEYSLPLRLWGEPMTMSCPALQLQLPQLPIFSQFLETQSTHNPGLVAPLPFSYVAADFSENQKMPENQSPPLLPNFYLFPGYESPVHPHRDGNAHTSRLRSPQTPLSRYPVPLFQEFPMMPGVFLPTTPAPLPATSAEAVTTPAPTGKPSLQPEFPALLQYPFAPFSKYPQSPQEQTVANAEPKPQHLHPQVFQIPMLYPFSHHSQLQNAPAPVASTDPPPPEKLVYQHPVALPYMFPSRFPYLHFFILQR